MGLSLVDDRLRKQDFDVLPGKVSHVPALELQCSVEEMERQTRGGARRQIRSFVVVDLATNFGHFVSKLGTLKRRLRPILSPHQLS